MINLFDIACNFSSDRFDNDLNEVIKRAKNNNVTKFLVVSASLKDVKKFIEFIKIIKIHVFLLLVFIPIMQIIDSLSSSR